MDALVAHEALVVRFIFNGRLLTLFARATLLAVPDEALDDGRVKVVASAMGHLATLGTLERIVALLPA